jgi:hypothetical protein
MSTIQDLAFEQKLKILQEGCRALIKKAGPRIGKAVYKTQVRILCKEFGKVFEEVWHE